MEGIASAMLGYSGRWREIAALNNLRYPFVSDDPAHWFGPLLSQGLLPNLAGSGSRRVRLLGERKEIVTAGTLILLDGYRTNASGNPEYVYDAIRVADFDPSNGNVTLDSATLAHEWPAGTRYRIYPPAADVTTTVARTGDRLFLPLIPTRQSNLVQQDTPEDLYGSDIRLNQDGTLALENGDLAVVTGFANVSQALWIRATLPLGSYLVHPDEGNGCYGLLGRPNSPELLLRSESALRAALETDPRVREVSRTRAVAAQADVIEVAAIVQLEASEEQVEINAIVRGRI